MPSKIAPHHLTIKAFESLVPLYFDLLFSLLHSLLEAAEVNFGPSESRCVAVTSQLHYFRREGDDVNGKELPVIRIHVGDRDNIISISEFEITGESCPEWKALLENSRFSKAWNICNQALFVAERLLVEQLNYKGALLYDRERLSVLMGGRYHYQWSEVSPDTIEQLIGKRIEELRRQVEFLTSEACVLPQFIKEDQHKVANRAIKMREERYWRESGRVTYPVSVEDEVKLDFTETDASKWSEEEIDFDWGQTKSSQIESSDKRRNFRGRQPVEFRQQIVGATRRRMKRRAGKLGRLQEIEAGTWFEEMSAAANNKAAKS